MLLTMPETPAVVLEVFRDHPLERVRLTAETLPPPGPGQVVLAVDRFGLSANNVVYAVLGDVLGHWAPFPAAPGWGRVPAWGAATVIGGDPAVASVGARFVGYLPMATHFTMRAVAAHPGLQDVSGDRDGLLPLYRELRRIDTDPTWSEERIDAEVLMLPIVRAAAILDGDLRRAGTRHVVISSASSKTSISTALLLAKRGVRVTGLSGRGRVQAAASVGAFAEVLPYDSVHAIPVTEEMALVDVAGDPAVVRSIHERAGSALARSIAVGGSHLPALGGMPTPDTTLPGPPVEQFKVGQREVELAEELGRPAVDEFEERARQVLVPWAHARLSVQHVDGIAGAQEAWARLVSGTLRALDAITVSPSGTVAGNPDSLAPPTQAPAGHAT